MEPKIMYSAPGLSINHTPAGAVTGGSPVQVGALVGISNQDITASVLGALAIAGFFSGVATSDTGSFGDDVYWDADADPVGGVSGSGACTTVATDGDFWLGTLVEAHAATDVRCFFDLNGSYTNSRLNNEVLASNIAHSTSVENTTTETTFDNASVTIDGAALRLGDILRVKADVWVEDDNSTDTLQLQLYLGTEVIWDSGAVNVAADDMGSVEVDIQINTLGSSGKFIASGAGSLGVPGTVVPAAFYLALATENISGDTDLKLTATWSVAHADNECECTRFIVEKLKNYKR